MDEEGPSTVPSECRPGHVYVMRTGFCHWQTSSVPFTLGAVGKLLHSAYIGISSYHKPNDFLVWN